MTGIHTTVSNPPLRPIAGKCEAHACPYEAKRNYCGSLLCLWHYYRAYRALEMNNDDPKEAA